MSTSLSGSEIAGVDRFARSRQLSERAHRLIPGGCHTYAKGDDQYPVNAPGIIVRGEGCRVWDADGNSFIEYGMGLRAVTLGHGYRPVVEAAYRQMQLGTNYTRAALVEGECAQEFLDLLSGDLMVKFAKNGSDATTAAVKLARAHTGRELVALCHDQPFFSTDDWFIATTAMDAGIPQGTRDLTVTFPYNDLAAVDDLLARHEGRIACLILEAATSTEPAPGYLEGLQERCRRAGVLLIFDEMITGFRFHVGGAQTQYGVTPDLSTFGKAMANGFAVAALAGRREIMERGGLRTADERVFLLSTTHGAETHALAAALETIRTYRREPVIETMRRQGERLRAGVEAVIAASGVGDAVSVAGHPANLVYLTKGPDGERSQAYRALFMQELIARGVLGPSFVISYAHRDEDIDATIEAVAGALPVYQRALEDGVEPYLHGRPVKPVFRRHC